MSPRKSAVPAGYVMTANGPRTPQEISAFVRAEREHLGAHADREPRFA